MPENLLKNPFRPAWWCPGAHTQTIFARFFRPFPALKLSRKRLETPDADFLDLDLLEGKNSQTPLVLILHGLEGSSQAPYVRSLLGEIEKLGWSAAVLNYRGCSGEPNRVQQTYHSGKSEDLNFVMDYFHKKQTGKIFLIGYSIGGNIVLKWLGEQGEKAKGKAQKAVAISVPYDLARSAGLMDQGFNREVYTRKLLSTLKLKARQKEKKFPGLVNQELVKKCRTFKIFDREVTARLNGFTDEKDYWIRSSSRYYLNRIQVETMLIHAEDDPFFPGKFLPLPEFKENPHLKTLFTSRGGHLGFVSGAWPWQQDLWLESVIAGFLKSRE